MYGVFDTPCTLLYTDALGGAAALSLGVGATVVVGPRTFHPQQDGTYLSDRDPATGWRETLYRNAPPLNPSTGDHNGRPFVMGA